MRNKLVRVDAPSRLHFGLIAMTMDSCRAFGGVGLACWHHRTTIEAMVSVGELKVRCADDEVRNRIFSLLTFLGYKDLEVFISAMPPRHTGFGSGTTLALGVIEAAETLFLGDVSRAAIVSKSRRGGASGIGIHSYFTGGLIADYGRINNPTLEFLPSGTGRLVADPKQPAIRVEWPTIWKVVIAYPPEVRGLYGDSEEGFMVNNARLKREECAQSALALFFELPGAVVSRDFVGLRTAMMESRSYGFKRREIERVPMVSEVIRRLDSCSEVAVTMSSFGPAVFIASKSPKDMDFALANLPSNWCILQGEVADSGRLVSIEF